MTHFYAHGGHVGADPRKRDALRHRSAVHPGPKHHNSPAHLRYFADELRRKGHGQDQILAHINPEEAMELGLSHGYNINPQTGLPQFGFWDNAKKFLPAVGGLIGSMLFPPLAPGLLPATLSGLGGAAVGGALGGTLGGAIANPEAPFRGTLPGLGVGAGGHLLGSMLGLGGSGAGAMGQMGGGAGRLLGGATSPMMATNILSSLMGKQNSGAPQQLAERTAAFNSLQKSAQVPENTGFFGSIGNGMRSFGNSILNNPLQSALLGTALYGTIHEGERARKHKEKTPHQIMNEMNPYAPENYKRSRIKRRRVLQPGDVGYDPENRYYEDTNPEIEYYAEGGYVEGDSGGQDDDVKAELKPDDYIMDATTVSLAGDGNSMSGAKRIKQEIEDKFARGGITRDYPHSHKMKPIDARLSPGEYRIPNHVVKAVGKGDPKEGAKVLDKMRNNLRKHKGVKKFLPPKSKPLTAYMR
jgi:hypothetical protein